MKLRSTKTIQQNTIFYITFKGRLYNGLAEFEQYMHINCNQSYILVSQILDCMNYERVLTYLRKSPNVKAA